ncbi:hypothetical protein ACVOMV_05490 [Mesorhizobium atlanticum]
MNKGLDARGIPPATVAKMKPWILSAMMCAAGLRGGARQSAGARADVSSPRTPRPRARTSKGSRPPSASCAPWPRRRSNST